MQSVVAGQAPTTLELMEEIPLGKKIKQAKGYLEHIYTPDKKFKREVRARIIRIRYITCGTLYMVTTETT